MRSLFVAGTGADIGKTHVACALLRAALADGLTADAFKPVVSGFDPDDAAASDPARLAEALEQSRTPWPVSRLVATARRWPPTSPRGWRGRPCC